MGDLAIGGSNTNSVRLVIDSWIASHSERNGYQKPDWILWGHGVNDLPGIQVGSITQASWLSDMAYIFDALHSAYPAAQILMAQIYHPSFPTERDLLDDVWMPLAVAGRESYVTIGPDDRAYLPGNLDGSNHPTPAGYSLMAAARQAAMGY